ncbi:hypothetical protein [Cystobacter ferrugineus]|uniref:Uncharacterized protein n=1 Tax=Cystobacter ferrugineus TaxID=83449 RepID=A0A1L9AUX3_9BACT|nr:hypothetical protein [Cystobacter ferrugineus]OJH33809.1 hypothetical protein BON30_46685 [Cystobacter ferrugineus]
MSTSIAVYLQASLLPDAGWLAKMVRAMEPKFAFAEAFDPQSDEGWVPCRIGEQECGFEWELEQVEALPQALAGQRFDHVATAGYRSSATDGICAALVAANIAVICGGVLEAPDGTLVDPDDALEWATDQVRALKKGGKTGKSRKPAGKPDPARLLEAGLAALCDARVTQLMRSLPDDPNVTIRFDRGVGLQSRRWTLVPDGQAPVSTRAMPRKLPDADQQALTKAFELLTAVLRAGPVASARFDADSLELTLQLSGATLVLHPQAAHYGSVEETLFRIHDRWDLYIDGGMVHPDVAVGRLVVG